MKPTTGWVVVYTDTRDDTTRTLRHPTTGQPYKKQASANTTADRVRSYDFTTDVRIESV